MRRGGAFAPTRSRGGGVEEYVSNREQILFSAVPLNVPRAGLIIGQFGDNTVGAEKGARVEFAFGVRHPIDVRPPRALNQRLELLIDRLGRHIFSEPSGSRALPSPQVREIPPGDRPHRW